jgi:hypothetical protein
MLNEFQFTRTASYTLCLHFWGISSLSTYLTDIKTTKTKMGVSHTIQNSIFEEMFLWKDRSFHRWFVSFGSPACVNLRQGVTWWTHVCVRERGQKTRQTDTQIDRQTDKQTDRKSVQVDGLKEVDGRLIWSRVSFMIESYRQTVDVWLSR